MEKYSFFLFLVVILCVGCSSDEIESMNTDTDYVEYLMNKCDEFADKYKIPLKLNKEKLQCVASQISVEDIECQFAVAAELFKSKTVVYPGDVDAISSLQHNSSELNKGIFSIQGVYLHTPQKELNIINGKKLLVS